MSMSIVDRMVVLAVVCCLGSGCASSRLSRMQAENLLLTTQLSENKQTVATLQRTTTDLEATVVEERSRRRSLEEDLEHEREVGALLRRDKGVRTTETATVRQSARQFVKEQILSLREFSEHHMMLDYVGAEIIKRDRTEGSASLLINLADPMPAGATLIGAVAYMSQPGAFSPCLLRQVDQELVVIWIGHSCEATEAGRFTPLFETPVSAAQGDLFGVICEGKVVIPFDRGTGRTGRGELPLEIGRRLALPSLDVSEARAYSFGATGFLE